MQPVQYLEEGWGRERGWECTETQEAVVLWEERDGKGLVVPSIMNSFLCPFTKLAPSKRNIGCIV